MMDIVGVVGVAAAVNLVAFTQWVGKQNFTYSESAYVNTVEEIVEVAEPINAVDYGVEAMNKIKAGNNKGTTDEWLAYGAALDIGRMCTLDDADYNNWLIRHGFNALSINDRFNALNAYRDRDYIRRHNAIQYCSMERVYSGIIKSRINRIKHRLSRDGEILFKPDPITIVDMPDILNKLGIVLGMNANNDKAADIIVNVMDRLSISTINSINRSL